MALTGPVVSLVAAQPDHPPASAVAPASDGASKGAHAAAPAPQEVHSVSAVLSPSQTYQAGVDAAVHKHHACLPKLFIMGMMAGIFIGLGFSTCALVGGNLSPEFRKAQPGAFYALYSVIGFPLGLVLIVFCGGDLFTGNCLYSLVAVLEGRIPLWGSVRLLVVSWISNLAGCLLILGLFDGARVWPGRDAYLVHLAEAKCSLGWGTVVVRGIIANQLVCLAVWLANSARDATGKIVGIYIPIMSFTSIGLEHCIANMYIVPMGMIQGADVTVGKFIAHNLIPATIGNWIGGAAGVGLFVACVYGAPGDRLWPAWERCVARTQASLLRCTQAGRRISVGHVHE